MENTFNIIYAGREISVERHATDKHNNAPFIAHLPDGDFEIEYTEDDEGAGRWLDAKAHHQTELSTELGQLITLYMAQHSTNF